MISRLRDEKDFLFAALVKLLTLMLMGYVVFFVLFFGGAYQVGVFASVASFFAPLVMFSNFRYVEYISCSDSVKKATLTALITSIFVFLSAVICFFVVKSKFGIFPEVSDSLFFVFVIYKILEQTADFFSTAFIVKKHLKFVAALAVLRFFLFFVLSLLLNVFFGESDFLICVVVALVFSYFICFVIDVIFFVSDYDGGVINFFEIFEYVSNNFGYGFLSMAISFNSSLPRYFLNYTGKMEILGIFSVVYQIAATVVNVFQQAVGIHGRRVSVFLKENLFLLYGSGVALFCFYGLFLLKMKGLVLFDDLIAHVLNGVFCFFMIAALLLRGWSLTAAVIVGGRGLQKFVFLSSVFSILSLSYAKVFFLGWSDLSLSYSFVVFSSLGTFFLILRYQFQKESF